MAKQTPEAPTPDSAGPAPAAAVDPKKIDAELSRTARKAHSVETSYDAKFKDAGTDTAKKTALEAEIKASSAEHLEDVKKRLGSDTAYKQFETQYAEKGAALKASVAKNELGFVTKTLAKVSDHSGKLAIGGALAALASKLFMSDKEVENPDGSKDKKTGFLKGALITLGAAVAIGAVAEKFGPTAGWASKIAGERHMKTAFAAVTNGATR